MHKVVQKVKTPIGALVSVALLLLLVGTITCLAIISRPKTDMTAKAKGAHLVTIHDRGIDETIVTTAKTIAGALKEAGITLDEKDTVEPAKDQEITSSQYQVNIYRARPVVVVDGTTREKIMTPYQTASQIAKSADITLYDEDIATVTRSNDIYDGAGLTLTIKRATPFEFTLYGKTFTARTQAKTVGKMLKEKGVTLSKDDRVTPSADTKITSGMVVHVWREGKQTITVTEPVDYDTETIQDANHNVGYSAIQTAGVAGEKNVTYEIVVQDGKEISRTQINSIVTKQPVAEVKIVGIKAIDGLTKSKGVDYFTDSNGVTHRETYYDLNMTSVMYNCGAGGTYIVRSDGVKVDNSGYILIAANLSTYPRCSVVETSLGLGKVYDTGGFVSTYPNGFDLATDWSDYNGQ